MTIHCSKGTYIRTLCDDIGKALGCGACMEKLVRTKVSSFSLENSVKLSDIECAVKDGTIEDLILPIDEVFSTYPKIVAKAEADKKLTNGNAIEVTQRTEEQMVVLEGEQVRMYLSNGQFVGIYYVKGHQFVLQKMFLEKE